ncbi:ABC transporter substrate-binding protein [Shinella sp. BYT-45]|uniref:ABC transporter substrate-binding protein n=1 Tax=Shinella sp. BYT-45 TaxID=3377377 RepID=UPI00397EFC17
MPTVRHCSRRGFCRMLGAAALAAAPAGRSHAHSAQAPLRIAALEHRIVETLLAIGLSPLAMQDPATYRRWVVEPPLPDGVVDLGTEAEPNVELLADLRPDLILTPEERPDLDRLAMIAPLRALTMTPAPGIREYAHFETVLLDLARLFARSASGHAAVSGVEADIAGARRRLIRRAGQPVFLVTFVDNRHVWVYGRSNLFQDVLDRVGLVNAWADEGTFDVVGIDKLADRKDARLVFIENNAPGVPADLAASPLWRALPFVRAGRVAGIASVTPFGALPTAGRFARLLAAAGDP